MKNLLAGCCSPNMCSSALLNLLGVRFSKDYHRPVLFINYIYKSYARVNRITILLEITTLSRIKKLRMCYIVVVSSFEFSVA